MDWHKIEDTCPKSFRKFISIMFPNVGLLSITTLDYFDNKKLYKFFDNQGIYLTIEMYNRNLWGYSISLDNGVVIGLTKEGRKNREDVELDGFMECFQILNKSIEDKVE